MNVQLLHKRKERILMVNVHFLYKHKHMLILNASSTNTKSSELAALIWQHVAHQLSIGRPHRRQVSDARGASHATQVPNFEALWRFKVRLATPPRHYHLYYLHG